MSRSPTRVACSTKRTGIVNGQIAPEPRGTNGFGYDPIFYYPPFKCTLAELDLERKATVSHRGQAFGALAAILNLNRGAEWSLNGARSAQVKLGSNLGILKSLQRHSDPRFGHCFQPSRAPARPTHSRNDS